ncbi:nuclear body protein SP140-like protein, partial [Silurus meridionalis]
MDPLNFLTHEDLLKFFHCKKTEISCIEEPHTFLNQLRDHNLLPEKLYQKVIKMKSKKRRQDGVYEILDTLEKKRGQCVKLFWTCVFQEHILQKYPVLRFLRSSLLDGQ